MLKYMTDLKTFTVNFDDFKDMEDKPLNYIIDKVSEILLDFYEDGKYSYSDFHSEGQPIPNTHRQYKNKIKKFLTDISKGKSVPNKALRAFIIYMYEMDESLIVKLKNDKRAIKTELKIYTKKYEDLHNNVQKQIINNVNQEVEARLQDLMEEEREELKRVRKTSGERFNIIKNMEKDLDMIRNNKSTDLQLAQDELLKSELQIKDLQNQLKKLKEKGSLGRPKLTKEQKKERKMQKLKEKMEKLSKSCSSDDSASSSEED